LEWNETHELLVRADDIGRKHKYRKKTQAGGEVGLEVNTEER